MPTFTYRSPQGHAEIWLRENPCPESGTGERLVHRWILSAGNAFRERGLPADQAHDLIIANLTRNEKPRGEVAEAIAKAYGANVGSKSTGSAKPKWPEGDLSLVEKIVADADGFRIDDLQDRSPIHFGDGLPHSAEVVEALFGCDDETLICIGRSRSQFTTNSFGALKDQLSGEQFIVPSPMSARTWTKDSGELSEKGNANTGPRRNIVIEFDIAKLDKAGKPTKWAPLIEKWQAAGITVKDAMAALIWHLKQKGPLVCVVDSGGKSLYAWFYCAGESEEPGSRLRRFFEYAVAIGADSATWTRSQFVRMPDGKRDNGNRQTVLYFDINAAKRADGEPRNSAEQQTEHFNTEGTNVKTEAQENGPQASAEEDLREFIRAQVAQSPGGKVDLTPIKTEAKRLGLDRSTWSRLLDEEIDGKNPETGCKPKHEDSTTMSAEELAKTVTGDPWEWYCGELDRVLGKDRAQKWHNTTEEEFEALLIELAGTDGAEVHFINQVLSDKRVGQNSKGEWRRLTDPDVSQEKSVCTGAIYESGKSKYWITSTEGEWIPATESAVKNYLENDRGVSPKTPDEGGPNPMREAMNFITRTANVEFATPLAGYSTGIYSFDGKRILVTNSPCIIRPKRGDWSTIKTLLEQMLGAEQLEYFFGWLQIAYKALASGDFVPGQIPVFVGPADCGKSLIQNKVITPILGGRDARPYQFMTAQTSFNSDLFKGEHLIIADETPATEYKERMAFGSAIKQLVAEPKQRLHAKGKDALTVEPFWRVTISINDEPENLMVLPPINDSIRDKLMLFKVKRAQCLPSDTENGRKAFAGALRRELPAFIHYLVGEHKIRQELKKGRFGIREYYNPEIALSVEELSTEAALMSIITQELLHDQALSDEWEGTAGELAARLKDPNSSVRGEAEKIIRNSMVLGKILGTLERSKGAYQGSVTSRKSSRGRLFAINKKYQNRDRE